MVMSKSKEVEGQASKLPAKSAELSVKKISEQELIKKLASTNITLQNKMIELVEGTSMLNQRIERILGLFEEASKHVVEVETTEAKIASLATKLETLLEQNKAIAKGLLLLEKYVRGKVGLEGAAGSMPRPKTVGEYGPER